MTVFFLFRWSLNNGGEREINEVIESLNRGCACQLSACARDRLIGGPQVRGPLSSTRRTTNAVAHLSAVRLLLFAHRRRISAMCRCSTVANVCSSVLANAAWQDRLVGALSHDDPYLRYAAVCAASEVLRSDAAPESRRAGLIRRLTAVANAAAMDALTRVLDSTATDRSPAHDPIAPGCCTGTVDPWSLDTDMRVRRLVLASLRGRWSGLVRSAIGQDRPATTVALLRLWRAVLTASCNRPRANLNFCRDLRVTERALYRRDADAYVWLNALRLFGAGLAGNGAQTLAAGMVAAVNRQRALGLLRRAADRLVDQRQRAAIVQDVVILVMRSLRALARRGPPVHRQIDHALDRLEAFVEPSYGHFGRWAVRLLQDRDDAVVECMLCQLDIADSVPASRDRLNPFVGFVEFLACVSFEPDVLLDYLISDENDFLLCALKMLKWACADIELFCRSCGDRADRTVDVLVRLRAKVLRLQRNNVFPYDIGPLARLIQRCYRLYCGVAAESEFATFPTV